jgi:cytochrome c556
MRAVFILAALALTACATTTALSQDSQPVDVRHAMQAEVNPAIVAIWDVTNNALNDNGELDAALISEAQWQQIASAAAAMAASTDRMAAADRFIAASPANWATEDYEVTMDVVQASLDAEPAGFRAFATAFSRSARQLEEAAKARDVARTGELVSAMDGECAGCHSAFWYPES